MIFNIKNIKLWDWLIIIVCLATVAYAFYTLNTLNDLQTIQDNCISKCNDHYTTEFNKKCRGAIDSELIPNYSIDLSFLE